MNEQSAKRQSDMLEVLRGCGKPMTAYQTIEEEQVDEPDITPLTLYPEVAPIPLCDPCGTVEKYNCDTLRPERTSFIAGSTFKTRRPTIEIHGQCSICTA